VGWVNGWSSLVMLLSKDELEQVRCNEAGGGRVVNCSSLVMLISKAELESV